MKFILVAVFAFGTVSGLLAEAPRHYVPVTLAVASTGKSSTTPDQLVTLVLDKSVIMYEAAPIANGSVIAFVDALLANNKASSVCVYVRAGTTYGELIRALDLLRQTNATTIGINPKELRAGREI